MPKILGELELESDNTLNSSWSNCIDDCLIGDEIIEEEEKLKIENEKVIKDEEWQYAISAEKENIETENQIKKEEAEIREQRYKRLMHLLKNSKMYAVLLRDRIQESERIKEVSNNGRNSKETSTKKSSSLAGFDLGEELSKKIEENILENENKKLGTGTLEKDFFINTRVTDMGFTVSSFQPTLLEGGVMRDYQLQGLEWMINLFINGVNGILADEMGLGKTIQVISFICYLIEQDIKGPFLIVAPLSTVTNWMSEIKRFAPKIPILLYHGAEAERKALLPKMHQTFSAGNKTAYSVVITSFQVPLKDKAILSKINWYYLIVDEGHRIKNHNSLLSRTLRQFNTIGRLLLTGTPFQNNLSELWSLLNFALPEMFSSLDVFESWFDIKELEKNGTKFMMEKFNLDVVNMLQEILIPFVLRREKKDVNLQLPPKKEILIYCPMTQHQKELYQATIDHSIEYLLKPREDALDLKGPLPKRRCFLNSPYGKAKAESRERQLTKADPPQKDSYLTKIVLSNPQMQLRKIVNHPYLIQFPLMPGTEEFRIDEDIVNESGKLLILNAMLAKLKSQGHKVIIFSYFKLVLNILEEYAIMRNYTYCRLDGALNIEDRDKEIKKFVSDPDIFIFLISIRAGGLGINLTAADTVIFFDSDWNPQVNLQSQDRCHRIGQTKPVVVYRLCAIGTIDENIIERGNAKRRLEKMILRKGKFTLNSKNKNLMDLQELKKLLESTDHDTVVNSNGFVLTDEQLETLLDRSFLYGESTPEDKSNKVFKVLNYEN